MRIVIATRIFAPETAASAFRLGAVAKALAAAGHAVKVVTTVAPRAAMEASSAHSGSPGGGGSRATRAATRATGRSWAPPPKQPRRGISVRRWPVLRDASGYVRGYVQYLSFDVPLLGRLLLGRRPDAILVEPPPTTGTVVRVAAALRHVPYVYYAADVWSDATIAMGAPPLVSAVVRILERFALRGADHVIAVSDGVAERVRCLAGHDRVTVVRGGVDTEVFSPKYSAADADSIDHPTSASDTESTGSTAVYAGTMSEWQGADVFVRALPTILSRVPLARLIFAGHGSARTDLEQLAASLGVAHAVTFVGVVPPDEAARLLRSARVGLVSIKPGQGYDFAVPTKLFATAACGTPVLFAGVGAARDIVSGATLGPTPGYDTDAIAEALTVALSHEPVPEERARLAEWARSNASLQAAARRVAGIIADTADPAHADQTRHTDEEAESAR